MLKPEIYRPRQSRIWQPAAAALMASACLATAAAGYFIDLANGVRPAGMGEAFVAVADDANSLLFNPAGVARISTPEASGMYADLYSNFNSRLYNQAKDRFGYNFIGLGLPLTAMQAGFGVGWTQFATQFYQENTLSLAYGKKLWEDEVGGSHFAAGASGKFMQWQVSANDFTTNPDDFPYADKGKYGLTADLGCLWQLNQHLSLGLSAENVVPADVGLTMVEYIPAIFRGGGSYIFLWKHAYLNLLRLSLEVSERSQVYVPRFGAETWWFGSQISLRAGINSDQVTSGFSYHHAWNEPPLSLQLDYAYGYPLKLQNTGGSHRLGMTLGWEPASNPKPGASAAKTVAGPAPAVPKVSAQTQTPQAEARATSPALEAAAEEKSTVNPVLPAVLEKPLVQPEKYSHKITIGLEQKIVSDFGGVRDIGPCMQALADYLKKSSSLKLECQFFTPSELAAAFQQGELDVVVAYDADLGKYRRSGWLKPVATVRTHGQTQQPCWLIVRATDPYTRPEELRGKRLGYSSSRVLKTLGQGFFADQPDFIAGNYFAAIVRQKNARDSLWALQMEAVDALVEYAYIGDVCQRIPEIKIRVIAKTEPTNNVPVLMRTSQYRVKNEQMQRTLTALWQYHRRPEAIKFMQIFPIECFVPYEEGK